MRTRIDSHPARSLSGALFIAVSAVGCAFSDGLPWGTVELDLQTEFDAAGRLDDQGRIRTAQDYLVTVERFDVSIVELAVTVASDGARLSFDPASPPPGYSLCHNGHCHADDGRLVDYADIEIELAGGSSDAGGVVVPIDLVFPVMPESALQRVPSCGADCALPRGRLSLATLFVDAVELVVFVEDRRVGDRARLPVEGVQARLPIRLDPPLSVADLLTGRIGRSSPPGLAVEAILTFDARAFDSVPWSEIEADPQIVHDALVQRLQETTTLTTAVERFNP